ncbi:hypothetical protein BH11PSE11_BH11PSE11_36800 [soil metagenome]
MPESVNRQPPSPTLRVSGHVNLTAQLANCAGLFAFHEKDEFAIVLGVRKQLIAGLFGECLEITD